MTDQTPPFGRQDQVVGQHTKPHPPNRNCECIDCAQTFYLERKRSGPEPVPSEGEKRFEDALGPLGVMQIHPSKLDNWKHRSVGMKCSTCMWFVEKVPDQGGAKVGRCRKHAPTLNGWPAMKLTDYCGDHKLDEEKIHGNA